jgi:hypothetical protein
VSSSVGKVSLADCPSGERHVPSSSPDLDTRASWRDFAATVEARLAAGVREYGDRSLTAAPGRLADEIGQELADAAAWSFILWQRIRALHERVDPEHYQGQFVGRAVVTQCVSCNSRGQVQRQDLADGHWYLRRCEWCEGTGSLTHCFGATG